MKTTYIQYPTDDSICRLLTTNARANERKNNKTYIYSTNPKNEITITDGCKKSRGPNL